MNRRYDYINLQCKWYPDGTDDRYKFEKNSFLVIQKKFHRSVPIDFFEIKSIML